MKPLFTAIILICSTALSLGQMAKVYSYKYSFRVYHPLKPKVLLDSNSTSSVVLKISGTILDPFSRPLKYNLKLLTSQDSIMEFNTTDSGHFQIELPPDYYKTVIRYNGNDQASFSMKLTKGYDYEYLINLDGVPLVTIYEIESSEKMNDIEIEAIKNCIINSSKPYWNCETNNFNISIRI